MELPFWDTYGAFVGRFCDWADWGDLPVVLTLDELKGAREESSELLAAVPTEITEWPELAVAFIEELECFNCRVLHAINHIEMRTTELTDIDKRAWQEAADGTISRLAADHLLPLMRLDCRALAYHRIFGGGTSPSPRLRRNGSTPRPGTNSDIIVGHLKDGLGRDAIAERVGCDVDVVSVVKSRYRHLLDGKTNTE